MKVKSFIILYRKLKCGEWRQIVYIMMLSCSTLLLIGITYSHRKHSNKDTEPKIRKIEKNLRSLHDYYYIINSSNVCEESSSVFLLIVVCSAVEHSDRRRAIRHTWGNKEELEQYYNARIIFMLGSSKKGHEVNKQVAKENDIYGDIVQEDFLDTYLNLTIKTIGAIKWSLNYCPQLQFMLKVDDDMFLNLPLLAQFIEREGKQRWIVGCEKQKNSPHPVGFGPMFLAGHPPFVAGAGYVISGDVLPALYQAAITTKIVPVEDAFVTGYCAKKLGVTPQHHHAFSCGEAVADDCDLANKFLGHKIGINRMYNIWETFSADPNPCSMDF